MFNEPKQIDIDIKVDELLAEKLKDDDVLIDALIACLPQYREQYHAEYEYMHDTAFELNEAIDKYIIDYHDLETKARDMLIAEKGNIVRTDVDDYEFVPHDTRD